MLGNKALQTVFAGKVAKMLLELGGVEKLVSETFTGHVTRQYNTIQLRSKWMQCPAGLDCPC